MVKVIGNKDAAHSYVRLKNDKIYYVVEKRKEIRQMLGEPVKKIEITIVDKGLDDKSVIPALVKHKVSIKKIIAYGKN